MSTDRRRLAIWTHLVRRFSGFLAATPLSPRDQAKVCGLLTDVEAALFWTQQPEDQRHALDVASRALHVRPGDRELAVAALLHDIGKRHVHLGAWRRAAATALDHLGLPLPRKYRRYRSHGPLGASDLEDTGSNSLAISFARHHPKEVPEGIDPERWSVLLSADHA